ncbi:MAG: hypothetical protein DCC51_12680 [Anaerolineae bacterium]|nr:MAG: hypothetical protein DCC51_12680 [Anaerolineae bacterium]
MIIAMFLAHLMGDYVLQWDSLAQWKAREFQGVVVHSLILAATTAIFAMPFGPGNWIVVLIISLSHFLIDAAQFFHKPKLSPLLRFSLDQAAHLIFIILALVAGGYLQWGAIVSGIIAGAEATPLLTAILGYAFVTMPAWVLLKYIVYGLVKRQPPNFPAGPNKYVGIVERVIITTLVLFGQAFLVPLVALPRMVIEWPRVSRSEGDRIYMIELISSAFLAVGVGLTLSLLLF